MAIIITGQVKLDAIDKPSKVKTFGSCLTTDTKPTDWNDGSEITVLNDTTKVVDSIWIFHGVAWYKK